MHNILKRILCLALCAVMLCGMLPGINASATETEPAVTEVPEETSEVTAATEETEITTEDTTEVTDVTEETVTPDVLAVTEAVENSGVEEAVAISESTDATEDIGNRVVFSTVQEAAEYIRDGGINRTFEQTTDSSIQFSIAIDGSAAENEVELAEQIDHIVRAHTGDPEGGDYLERNGSFYRDIYSQDGDWFIDGGFTYMFTHAQDEELDTAVKQLLDELNLYNASEYEKVRGIFDWMCLNIKYDYTYTNYSAYDALCKRSVVCQGYASLFYRLCLNLGVDCRYCGGYAIDGFGTPENHAWNIVRLDGHYYYIDTTWGAGNNPAYDYFLKGTDGMTDHIVNVSRWEADIGDYCTVSQDDYPVPGMDIIVDRGKLSGTVSFTMTKGKKLTITGTGEITQEHKERWNKAEPFPTDVVIGEGITSIGPGAFENLQSIQKVTLPDSLVSIGENAFNSSPIFSIHIPANVSSIGGNAFYTRMVNSITVDPANPWFTAVENCLFTKDMKTLVNYGGIVDKDGNLITTYQVPEGVETIGAYAFRWQEILTNIVLPDSVKYIEEYAFETCVYAEIIIPETLVSIGASAFEGCNTITSFYIGKDVSYIGDSALSCHRLKYIEVHPDNPYYASVDGILFNRDKTVLIRYPVARPDTTYRIPDGVTEIYSGAFWGFQSSLIAGANLETIIFPDSLITIGDHAFRNQVNIKELDLPKNLESIGDYAFINYPDLDTIVIPDSVKRIGAYAFSYNGAETIIIGKGIEYIGDHAFVRTGYAADNENAEIRVYFRGKPPLEVGTHQDNQNILFGYNPEFGNNNSRVYATVYYPSAYRSSWAPKGQTTWRPNPKVSYHKYPLLPYEHPVECIFESTVISPTCTEQGYTLYVCSYCDNSYTDDYIEAVGHMEVIDPAVEMTCTIAGKTEGTHCSVCGEIIIAQEIAPAPGHCFEDGVCTVCGADWLLGDANGDGLIDFSDAVLVLEYSAFLIDGTQIDLSACDVNGDGSVDFSDAVLILEYSAFLITEFPAANK